jgi:HSP20 family protein
MALTPWEPFEEWTREPFAGILPLRDAMSRLLEESFISPTRFEPFRRAFPVDIRETDTEYVLEASLPGIKPDEMEITALENTLTIRATRKYAEEKKEAGRYVRREQYVGEVSRTIGLPGTIMPDKITAAYEHGVLTLHVPKAEAAKRTSIKVKVKEPSTSH